MNPCIDRASGISGALLLYIDRPSARDDVTGMQALDVLFNLFNIGQHRDNCFMCPHTPEGNKNNGADAQPLPKEGGLIV